MFTYFAWILLFICIDITIIDCQLYEFDVCKRGHNGQLNHICRKIYDCPTAIEGLQNNVIPEICGYSQSVAIVCCRPSSNPQITTTTRATYTTTSTRRTTPTRRPQTPSTQRVTPPRITTTSTTTTKNRPARNPVSVVNEMCNRYKEFQYTTDVIPPQLIGETVTYNRRETCVTSVTLIVGGQVAEPKEFPHMALVGYGSSIKTVKWSCGGSLISERFVMTAAHCVHTSATTGIPKWVRLGELNYAIDTDDARPETLEIIDRIVHPNYRPSTSYDDIALLKLSRNVEFSEYIRPLCLQPSFNINDNRGIATGWGVIGTGFLGSEELLKVGLPFVNEATCNRSFVADSKVPQGIDRNKMLCAGVLEGGKDTCQGDSGGPIQIKDPSEPCMYIQVGITSFGNSFCAERNSPGVYTRVSNYIPWIQSIVWP